MKIASIVSLVLALSASGFATAQSGGMDHASMSGMHDAGFRPFQEIIGDISLYDRKGEPPHEIASTGVRLASHFIQPFNQWNRRRQ